MTSFAAALSPVLLLILLGYGLRRSGFVADSTWPGVEKLTYFVLFPALLVRTLGAQSVAGVPWPEMLIVVAGAVTIASVVVLGWYRLRRSVSGSTLTSVFQGGVRFNTYIALAVAQALYGSDGLALAAVAAGLMIVFVNVLCVFVFIRYGNAARSGASAYVREIIVNPLVLACVIGWCLSLSGTGLPGLAEDFLEIIGRAALPLGLLAVGAALRPESIAAHVGPTLAASFVQFVVKPVSALVLIAMVGLTGVAAAVVLITLMAPTAPSSYILARQLGGDAEAMASIITLQTLLAFLVMPLIAAFAL